MTWITRHKVFLAGSKCNWQSAGTSNATYNWWKPNKKQQLILLNILKVGHFWSLLRLFLLFLMFNWKKIVQWSLLRDSICDPLLVGSNRFINWAPTTAKLIFANNQENFQLLRKLSSSTATPQPNTSWSPTTPSSFQPRNLESIERLRCQVMLRPAAQLERKGNIISSRSGPIRNYKKSSGLYTKRIISE